MATTTTFRQQLAIAMTVGVLCIALFSSVVSSWQGSRQIRGTLVGQGERITDSLATHSTLALLYGSSDNAAVYGRYVLEASTAGVRTGRPWAARRGSPRPVAASSRSGSVARSSSSHANWWCSWRRSRSAWAATAMSWAGTMKGSAALE